MEVHRNILVTYFPPLQESTFHTQRDRNSRNFIYFDAKHGSSRIKLSFLKLKILDIFRQLFFFFCEKWQVLLQHIPSLQDATCSSFPPVYCYWKTNAKFPPFCTLCRFPAAPLARWQPSPNTSHLIHHYGEREMVAELWKCTTYLDLWGISEPHPGFGDTVLCTGLFSACRAPISVKTTAQHGLCYQIFMEDSWLTLGKMWMGSSAAAPVDVKIRSWLNSYSAGCNLSLNTPFWLLQGT